MLGVASLLLLSLLGQAPSSTTAYNLVAIVTDDQGVWTLGCMGNKEVKTPNLDRLASQGALFTNAFVATPVCSPSRTEYLTGRYGTELGITDYISQSQHEAGWGLPPGTVTWPRILQQNGIRTGMIGKWHLGGQPHQHPRQCGFDFFTGALEGSFNPKNPTLEREGSSQVVPGFSSEIVVDEALSFLRSTKKERFALCVHFREPHTPYTPMPPVDVAEYAHLDPTVPMRPGLNIAQTKQWTREYYTCIHAIDRNLGRLLKELDDLGLAENTIVTFTSDHGYNIGHHGIHTKGNGWWMLGGERGPKRPNMWDRSLRVPLLVRWPGIVKAGTVVEEMATNLDMFPTVLSMMGVTMPTNVTQRGLDLVPLLTKKTTETRDRIYGQYDLHNGGLAYMRMVRTDRWKLVRFLRTEGLDELYDLEKDPEEQQNLYERPVVRATRDELNADLLRWMKSIGDPLAEDRTIGSTKHGQPEDSVN